MDWIGEIRRLGDNLVSEFRRIADESEARVQAVEVAHAQNLKALNSLETRVGTLERQDPRSAD